MFDLLLQAGEDRADVPLQRENSTINVSACGPRRLKRQCWSDPVELIHLAVHTMPLK